MHHLGSQYPAILISFLVVLILLYWHLEFIIICCKSLFDKYSYYLPCFASIFPHQISWRPLSCTTVLSDNDSLRTRYTLHVQRLPGTCTFLACVLHIYPSGVRALPLAAGINESGHYFR